MAFAWALRNLSRHRLRSALVLLGLAVTSAMLLDMILLSGGLERSFEQLLLGRGYQVRISPRGTLPFDTEATIPNATRLVTTLREDSSVVSVAPLLGGSIYARMSDSLLTLFGYGVDPMSQALYQVTQGEDLLPADRNGIILSAPAARLLHAGIGDTVRLVGVLDPQMAQGRAEAVLVVRGFVRWLYDYEGQPSVGAWLPVMQALTARSIGDRVSFIAVRIRDGVAVDPVVERLRRGLPTLEINSVGDMVAHFRDRMVYFHQLSLILGTISLIVTLLLVTTLLTITVNERLGEIATLRAIGVSRRRIVEGVVAEGVLLTLVGGVLGTALGLATARYLDAILTSFPGLPASISFFVPRASGLLLAGGVLLVAGTFAGTYPAWLAARAPIAATLRAEAT
ncbi:MAG: FtsX-like permease family protein [Gemmatimonadota bacterium]